MNRPGAVSLAELVIVLWLFGFVLLAVSAVVAGQRRLAAGQRDLVRFQEAIRTARVVLGSELRWLAHGDASRLGSGALRVRAVRGGGPVCRLEAEVLELGYTGVRLPDPSKDSLLLVHASGSAVHQILDVREGLCAPGSLRLSLDSRPVSNAHFALVFEAGTYHIDNGALRYQLGGAGRQPLTEAILGGRFVALPGSGGLRLDLVLSTDSLPMAPRTASLGLPSLNATDEPGP